MLASHSDKCSSALFQSPYADSMSTANGKTSKVSNGNTPTTTNHEEMQYLTLVDTVIKHGEHRADRTGTGTLSLFAPPQLRFSLSNNVLPLFTTKRVAVRAVFEELMWFLRGQTDQLTLKEKGVGIWDGNASRAYLDSVGLTENREGDLGPVYGFQWRHFGAEYQGPEHDYSNEGVDQLREVIRKLKENPTDRRIIMSAWNPRDMKRMALPPCHLLCQFYVSLPTMEEQKPKLSCQLYQRSADLGLGLPFNVTSYAILTALLAYVTNMAPSQLIITLGDAHVYKDHIGPLEIQLQREPREFPTVELLPKDTQSSTEDRGSWTVDKALEELLDFSYDRLRIHNYNPLGKIVMAMSV